MAARIRARCDKLTKPRILILSPYFLPSRLGGGSVRALVNLVDHLRQDFDFVIAASKHDLHTSLPYAEALQQQTREATGLDIRYLPRGLCLWGILRTLLSERWDLIYLNSFLSARYTALPLLLRRLQRRNQTPALLAPRGELLGGSLQHRRRSKLAYLGLMRHSDILTRLGFHATSPEEAAVLEAFGLRPVLESPDLPPLLAGALAAPQSLPLGVLRMVFLSRIDPTKNLCFALRTLALVQAPLQFDIVGPIGNADYWSQCQRLIAALPAHVQVRYLGAVVPEQVMQTFSRYELFFFPSRSENNGYVILEALLGGCALLLSDRTPWRDLAALGVGQDLPLDAEQQFSSVIDAFATTPEPLRLAQRRRAQAYGVERLTAQHDVESMRALLLHAIAGV
jgi:glycosyltransferase involved in cell wall biosynthesis